MMIVRRFKESDALRMSEIVWLALDVNNSKDYGPEVLSSMKKEYTAEHICLLSQKRSFFVLEDSDYILGLGGLEGNLICSVFVDPQQQGRGVGKLIMQELESLAKIQGYSFVFLHSSFTAETFYNKIGYSAEKRIFDPISGENIWMKKSL